MNPTKGLYTPSTPGAVECPACGAVLTTLPVAALPCHLIVLTTCVCPRCGQQWEDLRHQREGWAQRFWTPQPALA